MIQRLRFALATLGVVLLCSLGGPARGDDTLPAASFTTIEITTGSPNPHRFRPAPTELPRAAPEVEAAAPDAEGFEPEGQVQLDVRFVAVDGSHAIDLADGMPRAALVREPSPAPSSEPVATSVRVRRVVEQLDARLADLQADGDLRVLAHTTLLTASGTTAEFDGRGMAPATAPDGHSVGFRPYGARLVLHPRVGADGAIHLAIRGELTGDSQDAGGPRQLMAAERLRHGETLLVAHLFDDFPAEPRPGPGWFARTPIGKALIKPRPPPAQTQLALIVTARLPVDANPQRVLATLTAEDLEPPAMPRARGPPLRGALAHLAQRVRAALSPPVTGARAGWTWSARLMVRAGRAIAHA